MRRSQSKLKYRERHNLSMQKTSDKRIQEELMKLHSSSMKDSLENLSPAERKAAKEAVKDLITGWARSTGRAEVFKKDEYPEFVGREGTRQEKQVNAKLLKSLEKIAKELELELGDEFIAISLYGSYAKGYAGKGSDADVMLLLRNIHGRDKLWKAYDVINKLVDDMIDWKVHADFYWLADAKDHIHALKEDNSMISGDIDAAHHVFVFFTGKTFGKGIDEARKELIEELAKNPHGKLVWGEVRAFHNVAVVSLLQKGLNIREHEAPKRLGVTVEEFREILKAREEFNLPTFEDMKRRYRVAEKKEQAPKLPESM